MMVRSAVNAVSNTHAKPSRRRAVTNGPSTSVPGLEAELLGQADRHRRRVLDDDDLRGIGEGRAHLVDGAGLDQRAHRAHRHALAAVDAAADVEALVERRADPRLAAAPDEVDRPDRLHLLAHAHALAAQDALRRVADNRRARHVHARRRPASEVVPAADAELRGEVLQLALVVPGAVEAVVRVVGEEQFDQRAAGVDGARRMGLHLEAGGRRKRAARHEAALALDLDHAHPARAARRQALVVAQRGNLDAGPPRRPEQRVAVLRLHLASVDFECHRRSRSQ